METFLAILLAVLVALVCGFVFGTITWYAYLEFADNKLHDENRRVGLLFKAIFNRDGKLFREVLLAFFPYNVPRWNEELAVFQVFPSVGGLVGSVGAGILVGGPTAMVAGIIGVGLVLAAMVVLTAIGLFITNVF